MATIDFTKVMSALDKARLDPASQIRSILDKVEALTNGEVTYVDPTNPAVFLLEAACATSAHALNQMDVLTRKRYASLALTREDLYLHMSDRDYLGAFATPPTAVIGIALSLEEIKHYAVEVTAGGMRKLVMPKNSNFTVDGHTFTLEYPIEFRIMPHGGLSVIYGAPVNGALFEIANNLIEWDIAAYDGVTEFVRLFLKLRQMAIASQVYQTNAATVFNTRIGFTDQYHYTRAYARKTVDGVSRWVEIKTTYTDQVFDPYTPTVLLKVLDGVLEAHVPLIYLTNGLVSGELRLDVYTTKAVNNKVLSDYGDGSFVVVWEDLDNEDDGRYTANFSMLSTYGVFSNGYTSGGRPALTLEELRARVTEHNSGPINLPITHVNRERVLDDLGYDSVTQVDAITRRTLSATRPMPVPLDGYTVTPVNAATETMIVRLADLAGVPGISHNGERITLHPSVLYKNAAGGLSIVDETEKADLRLLKPEAMARSVTEAGYRFSPFHYVLDATNNNFSMRAYYLDAPEINGRRFIAENPSAQLELQSARSVTVSRITNGYRITLITNSGKSYQDLEDHQVHVQLAYVPPGETDRAYLNGTLVAKSGKERIWEFDLITDYDITDGNALILNNFSMFSDGPLPHPIDLGVTFDLVYAVSDYTVANLRSSDIDLIKSGTMLPYDSVGILHEQVKVALGTALKYLWTGSRTVISPEDYEVHTVDVPARYEQPVFQRDADGALEIVEVDGVLTATVLHNAGDLVYTEDGQPVYKALAGDPVLDEEGNKVLKNARQLARQIDMTLLDGRYYFANDQSSADYMTQICNSVVTWTNTDLSEFNRMALDKTTVFFRPLNTTGRLTVVVGEGVEVTIDAEQALKVNVYMTEQGHKNDDLKTNIRRSVIGIVASAFTASTVSVKDITTAIDEQTGEDVLGIEISGLGGERNFPLITMRDGEGRPSVRKKLVAKADGTFSVEEDIEINFIAHLPVRAQG